MNTRPLTIALLGLVAILGGFFLYRTAGDRPPAGPAAPGPSPTTTEERPATTTQDALVRVTAPLANDLVQSPLRVAGTARGNWYFEASFPVRLEDANGRALGVAPAQAQGEWMTTDFVPFALSLPFATPTTDTGFLVLEKDNPSGLPQNADERRIPVRFERRSVPVTLFFYDEARDRDAAGNIRCSAQGLVAVNRTVPVSATPIQEAVRELLRAEPNTDERARGLTSGFPLADVALKGASLADGTLALEFADPRNATGGGSCRVALLRAQIEATVKRFPAVKRVVFKPDSLFQP